MKKVLIGLLLGAVLAMGTYFGKSYFDSHYVLLNEQDVVALSQAIQTNMEMAYQTGKTVCNKITSN